VDDDEGYCEHGGEEDPFHSSTSSARSWIDWGIVSSNPVLEKSSFAPATPSPECGILRNASVIHWGSK